MRQGGQKIHRETQTELTGQYLSHHVRDQKQCRERRTGWHIVEKSLPLATYLAESTFFGIFALNAFQGALRLCSYCCEVPYFGPRP